MFKFTQQKIFKVKNELVYVIDRCYIILIVKVEKSNLILTLLFFVNRFELQLLYDIEI
jgi:hypothetical protein